MSGLLSTPPKVESHLDALFKNSVRICLFIILIFCLLNNWSIYSFLQAGKSEIAVKPILAEEVIANATKKKKSQDKKEANKAFLGFKKAKELIANANKVRQDFWSRYCQTTCPRLTVLFNISLEKSRRIRSWKSKEGQEGIDCWRKGRERIKNRFCWQLGCRSDWKSMYIDMDFRIFTIDRENTQLFCISIGGL